MQQNLPSKVGIEVLKSGVCDAAGSECCTIGWITYKTHILKYLT